MRHAGRWAVWALVLALAGCGGGKGRQPSRDPAVELASKVRMAQGYMRAGRIGLAIESMDEAVAMKPDSAGLRNLSGQIYFVAGKYAQAEAAFEKALELDPYLTDAHNSLGALYNEMGRPADAERHLRLALQDSSYTTPQKVYLNLGVLYGSQGRDDEAIDSIRKAVQIDPDYYRAHFELAGLLDRQGQLEEAAREYEVAHPEYRDSAEFHYRLGFVYFRLGNRDKAREHLRRVLDLSPGSDNAVRADELLSTLS